MSDQIFMPEYGTQRVGNRFQPIYRLFEGTSWRVVISGGKPVMMGNKGDALEAAKRRVRMLLNPNLR